MHLLNISDDELNIVRNILLGYLPHGSVAWAFGSRVKGTDHRFSDLDVLIKPGKSFSAGHFALMQEAFSESDLPFRVDATCWDDMSENFRKQIRDDLIPFDIVASVDVPERQ
jgi:predicted nucleotidyltransferase